mmetsp:Transcript_450/g.1579  ORF Transcript_450/g.1579 Transcript_450/m.1579 type:complete len:858 (-) Transcript_450:120-2693(-)
MQELATARALLKEGRPAQAQLLASKCVEAGPQQGLPWFVLAQAHALLAKSAGDVSSKEENEGSAVLAFVQAASLDPRLAKPALLNARMLARGALPGEWFASQADTERLQKWLGEIRRLLTANLGKHSHIICLGMKGHGPGYSLGSRIAHEYASLRSGLATGGHGSPTEQGGRVLKLTILEESQVILKTMGRSAFRSNLPETVASSVVADFASLHSVQTEESSYTNEFGDSEVEALGLVVDILPTRNVVKVAKEVAKAIQLRKRSLQATNRDLIVSFVLPSAIRVQAMVIESSDLDSTLTYVDKSQRMAPEEVSSVPGTIEPNCANDFDLSAFVNAFPRSGRGVRLNDYQHTVLSERFTAFTVPLMPSANQSLDDWLSMVLSNSACLSSPEVSRIAVIKSGRAQYIAMWLDLYLGEQTVSYAPQACSPPHIWQHVVSLPTEQRIHVERDTELEVQSCLGSQGIIFNISRTSEDASFCPQTAEARLPGDALPMYHYRILNDSVRNWFFLASLRSAVAAKKRAKRHVTVLDIGTGSGLLSLLAVAAGATEVIACERDQLMAKVAAQVMLDNNFGDRVKIVSKHSTQLRTKHASDGQRGVETSVGYDLKAPVDIVVGEILGDNPVSEGIVPVFEHAKDYLCAKDCIFIPQCVQVWVALASSHWLKTCMPARLLPGAQSNGSFPALSVLSMNEVCVDLTSVPDLRLITKPIVIHTFDFAQRVGNSGTFVATVRAFTPDDDNEQRAGDGAREVMDKMGLASERNVECELTQSLNGGVCNIVCYWFAIEQPCSERDMPTECVIRCSTAPHRRRPRLSWEQCAAPIEDLELGAGCEATIELQFMGDRMQFSACASGQGREGPLTA